MSTFPRAGSNGRWRRPSGLQAASTQLSRTVAVSRRGSSCNIAGLENGEPLKRDAKTFAVVLVSLPYFRDERGARRLLVEHPEYVAEINLAFADLEALAIDAARVGHVNMGDERADRFHELVE